VRLRLPLLLLG
jgi:hypothetical protein